MYINRGLKCQPIPIHIAETDNHRYDRDDIDIAIDRDMVDISNVADSKKNLWSILIPRFQTLISITSPSRALKLTKYLDVC